QDLAKVVCVAIIEGNIHKKLSIQLDSEMRYGEVHFNNHLLYAKCVDLPTVIESYKTADKVNLYKTADICQLLVCNREPQKEPEKEPEPEPPVEEKEADKEFLWPHGLTPPFRHVRKRRINIALRAKNIVASDIVREVNDLLRMDNEAVRVDYEVIGDDDVKTDNEM
ncbi:hypothetical protein KR222_004001, partial [Zaprionus bogoriensis]